MKKPRIFLAEGHEMVLDGLRALLERHYDLVGTAKDGLSAVREARRLHPDLIVMDVALSGISGLEAGQRLRQQEPKVKLLYLSMYGDKEYVEEALRIGASGYVLKGSGLGALFSCHPVCPRRKAICVAGIVFPKFLNRRSHVQDLLRERQRSVAGKRMCERSPRSSRDDASQREIRIHKTRRRL